MPRNSSGIYTLPVGNPVVTATTIASAWANGTFTDVATEVTNSLDRSGRGGMLAFLRGVDGTVAAPMFAFTAEASTGLWRSGAGEINVAILGVTAGKFNSGGWVGHSSLDVAKAGDTMTGTLNLTPVAGLALSATGVSGSLIADFVIGASGLPGIIRIRNTGAGAGTKTRLQLDDATADLGYLEGDVNGTTVSLKAVNRNNILDFWTGSAGGAQRMSISATGLVSILGQSTFANAVNYNDGSAIGIYGRASSFISGGSATAIGFRSDGGAGFQWGLSGGAAVLTLDASARLSGTGLHNNASPPTGTAQQYIASGTYTPTLTNTTNVAASTPRVGRWIRVGNVVYVNGHADVTATGAGGVQTVMGISLPIASTIAAVTDLDGVATANLLAGGVSQGVGQFGDIEGNVGSARATLFYNSSTTSNVTFKYSYSYTVL